MENKMDMFNSKNDTLTNIGKQSTNLEEFLFRLSNKIDSLGRLIDKLEENEISNDYKEDVLKELKTTKTFFEEIKSDKNFLNDITIPNFEKTEMEKDYDGDGISNEDEIKLGRNIMINEEANKPNDNTKKGFNIKKDIFENTKDDVIR